MFEKVKHEKLRPDTCPQDSELTGGEREGEDGQRPDVTLSASQIELKVF